MKLIKIFVVVVSIVAVDVMDFVDAVVVDAFKKMIIFRPNIFISVSLRIKFIVKNVLS
jgi:hypothetical protein